MGGVPGSVIYLHPFSIDQVISATMSFARTFLQTSRALSARNSINPVQHALGNKGQAQFLGAARSYATAFERSKPHVNIGTIGHSRSLKFARQLKGLEKNDVRSSGVAGERGEREEECTAISFPPSFFNPLASPPPLLRAMGKEKKRQMVPVDSCSMFNPCTFRTRKQ